MLDVMKRPPRVAETIEWRACRVELPDADTTVHVFMPGDDEPVWLGYFDDEDGEWKSVDGFTIGMVTWWAPMLAGPIEPTAEEVATAGECTEGDRCVCGGDLPRVRAGCSNWRLKHGAPR